MHALDLDTLLIEQKPLHAPALSELGEGECPSIGSNGHRSERSYFIVSFPHFPTT